MSGLLTGELVGLFNPLTKAAVGVIDAGGKEQIGLGLGIPVGGATGQALVKNSSTDGDAGWGSVYAPNPPATVTNAAGFTFNVLSHANRDIGWNNASPGTLTFDGLAGFAHKDGFRLMQEGAGAVTLAPGFINGSSGSLVTFTNQNSLSLTTTGIGTYIDVEYDTIILSGSLVITSVGSVASAVSAIPSIFKQMITQYGISIPQLTGGVSYSQVGLPAPSTAGSAAVVCSSADGTVGYGQIRRVRWPGAASGTANNQCGWSRNNVFRVDSGGDLNGGFPLLLAVAVSDASPTLGTLFLGLGNSIANTATLDPSAFTAALIGISKDNANANLNVIYSAGGTPTVVALGALFVIAQYKAVAVLIDKNTAGTAFYITPYYLSASDVWTAGSTTTATTNIPTAANVSLNAVCIRSTVANTTFSPSVDDIGMWKGKAA
jgi:hypothetical protein